MTASLSEQSTDGQHDVFRRIALGCALGVVIGLTPKDSLLPYAMFCLLMVTTANLLAALSSGLLFSVLATQLETFNHKLGGLLLTSDRLESTWAWLAALPIVPWTRFNNTVVLGSFVTGLALLLPTYILVSMLLERFGSKLWERISAIRLVRWLTSSLTRATATKPVQVGGDA